MDRRIEEMRQKQKKLTLLLGEKVYRLYKSQGVRLLYTSEGVYEEEEVRKLVRLLDYLDERIQKFEELYGDDEAAGEECPEECESAETEIEEEPVNAAEEKAEEEVSEEEIAEATEEKVEEKVEKVLEEKAGEGTEEVIEEEIEEDEQKEVEEEKVCEEKIEIKEVFKEAEAPKAEEVKIEEPTTTPAEEVNEQPAKEVETVSVEAKVAQETAVSAVYSGDWRDALDNIFQTAVFSTEADRRIYDNSQKHLRNGSERERELAINQLAHISDKRALHKIYEFAMKHDSGAVRSAVIKQITRAKEVADEGLLKLGLSDADRKVRTAAIKALASHVTDAHQNLLEGLLKDNDPYTRGLAVTYLGIYYGKEGVQKAGALWNDESPYVRKSLVEMFSIVKPEKAITTIKNLLLDADNEVRRAAEAALDKLIPGRKAGKGSYVGK